MFKKSLLTVFLVVACFSAEKILAQLFGVWFKADFLIILIVFFNLSRGTRASLGVAFLAGFLRDCFATKMFGMSIFNYVACAYMTTLLKMYIYHIGSAAAHVLIVFLITIFSVCLQFVFTLTVSAVTFAGMFRHVLLPEVLATTILTPYTITKIRRCVSRLSA